MKKELKLGISTCPNDTFIFGAALRGEVVHPFALDTVMDDVQFLNELAMKQMLDVVKVSFGVFPKISENYKILKCGGALGFGCGPLLLSKKYRDVSELKDKRIAIPGLDTTAFMVFKLFFPECAVNITPIRFDEIMPALERGEYDAGLVIHEGRFTYQNYGLTKIADMGNLWESRYGCPIPLGFIAIKKTFVNHAGAVKKMITDSLSAAWENENTAYLFAKKYATDMHENVLKAHVKLYVNDFSYDMTPAAESVKILLNADDSVFV